MTNEDPRILSLLSLCARAGKAQTGETAAEKLLRNGEAQLLLISNDASDNTRKKFINKCFYYKKPILVYGDRDVLSRSVGKQNRTVFTITEPHFAERLRQLIEQALTSQENTATLVSRENAATLVSRENAATLQVNNMEVAECQKSAYTN